MRLNWKKWGRRFSGAYLLSALYTPAFWFMQYAGESQYIGWPAQIFQILLLIAPIITLLFLKDLTSVAPDK